MNKLPCLLISLSIFLYSCSEDGATNETLTADEASAEINSIASKAGADITTMAESDGVNAALELIELIESYDFSNSARHKKDVKTQINHFFKTFVSGPSSRTTGDEITSLDDIKGLYVWNPATQTFDEFESEFFIIQFPTEDSSENNAELKISELTLEEIEGEYLPTKIEAYLKVDSQEVISLNLEVQWSADAFPNFANITLDINPFSYTLGFDNLGTTSSSLLSSLKLNGEEILGFDTDITFESELKEEPSSIEGYVLYYNLRVAGDVNVPSEEEELDPSYDVNNFVNLEVLIDDEKIGDVVFVGDNEVAYIQYLDGTTEALEALFETAIADLEDAIDGFEG